MLATGQKFVAYGIPGTRKEYSWPTTHLADTPRDSIPVITRAQAEAFIATPRSSPATEAGSWCAVALGTHA